MTPQIRGSFFFLAYVQVCCDREISIVKEFLCRAHVHVVCAPRSSRVRAQSAVTARPGLIVCALRVLLPRAQALSCQLCRDLAVPCCDMTSMSRPKLNRDLECQVTTWEPQTLSKSVTKEFPYRTHNSVRIPIARACLSCTLGSVVGSRAPLSWLAQSRLGSPLS